MARTLRVCRVLSVLSWVVLSSAPLAACARRNPPTAAPSGAANDSEPTGRNQPVAGPACEARFVEMDTNRDERVTLQEFLAHPHRFPNPEQIFAERDKNHDGLLTLAEFCSTPGRTGTDTETATEADTGLPRWAR